jgi:hypothetical protein
LDCAKVIVPFADGNVLLTYKLKGIGSTIALFPPLEAKNESTILRLYFAGLPYFKITSYSKNDLNVFENETNC